MKRYLLDTSPLSAYLHNREAAIQLISPWIRSDEAATCLVVYGEIVEYLHGRPGFARRPVELRELLRQVTPHLLTYAILKRYALLRRQLRPPHGPGLIGDVDTLIAATAIEHGLTVVTADADFQRVPGLQVLHVRLR